MPGQTPDERAESAARLAEQGFTGVKLHLGHGAAEDIATVAAIREATIRPALAELAGSGADAIVQVGTDLAMARLADEAERWLGVPVVAVNAAMLWHALRACGVHDQRPGYGTLLRAH